MKPLTMWYPCIRSCILLILTLMPWLCVVHADDQSEALSILRQQIEAMPLSPEDKQRLLETQMKALAGPSAREQQWYNAHEIHYQITGEYNDRTNLDATGNAHVRDHVEIEFTSDTQGNLKTKVAIRNFPTELNDIQPSTKGCLAPMLHGPFEFYTLQALEPLTPNGPLAPQATARYTRQFPAMTLAAVCTGKRQEAAHTEQGLDAFRIPLSGEFLRQKSDSITMKLLGWTWTYQAEPR